MMVGDVRVTSLSMDHLVICKAALIFAITRWIFFWAQRFLKYYMCKYSSSLENESPSPSPCAEASADFSLAIAKENLRSTTFGDVENHRLNLAGSCQKSCVVCLERFRRKSQVSELCNCGHVFHRLCLDRWLRYDARMTCPLCRTPLVDMKPETSLVSQQPPPPPNWAVERILYLFGDDLLGAYSCSSLSESH